LKRFNQKFSPEEMVILERAYRFTKYCHRAQIRETGARYFEHLRATANIIADELQMFDLNLICAAFLHDSLEDQFMFKPEDLILNFSEEVAMLVKKVTKPDESDSRFKNEKESLDWYHDQIENSSEKVIILKLADRLQNTRALWVCPEEKRLRKIKETKEVYLPLINKIYILYPEKAKVFWEQFKVALEKLEKKE